MSFQPSQFSRSGVIRCRATIEEVFPLLCPKKEEDWIPGWQCETIWSHSGYNEDGAIFRTTKPYGTELYWNTVRYDIRERLVEFLIVAPGLFMFRFRIDVQPEADGELTLHFAQTFTSISADGSEFLQRYAGDNYADRLATLQNHLTAYLHANRPH